MNVKSKGKSQKARVKSALALGALLLLLVALSAPAFAQCSMCYQTAAAQGARGQHALNLGILLLLLPVVSIIGCISVTVYRSRER